MRIGPSLREGAGLSSSRRTGFADEPEAKPEPEAPKDDLMEDCVSDSMILYFDSASFLPSEMESRTLLRGAAERKDSDSEVRDGTGVSALCLDSGTGTNGKGVDAPLGRDDLCP